METDHKLEVGAHVKVRYSSDTDQPKKDWPLEAGVLVEDFGEQTEVASTRDWAVARRWAVALDSGRLVFADTEDLQAG